MILLNLASGLAIVDRRSNVGVQPKNRLKRDVK
jgi:hypothetical protein